MQRLIRMYWFLSQAVCQKMIDLGHEAVEAGDVVAVCALSLGPIRSSPHSLCHVLSFVCGQNEIFDMVEPATPHQITIDDLLRSKVGGTIVSILSDVNGFWKYDNREVLIQTT